MAKVNSKYFLVGDDDVFTLHNRYHSKVKIFQSKLTCKDKDKKISQDRAIKSILNDIHECILQRIISIK